jgi:pyrimidine 5'-nucleotidase
MTRAVLFDLDDTLFDHYGSAGTALRTVQEAFAPSIAFDDFEDRHTRYLEEMHTEVLAGRIDLDEARRERFRRVFGSLGLPLKDATADRVATLYRAGYLAARQAMAGAGELLEALHARVPIAIVSNNLLEEQTDKLRLCGFDRFIDHLVVSEEIGITKPDPAIFRFALDRLGVPADQAVMVGDSWPADIVGARRAGIRAVWFNPRHLAPPERDAAVAEIASLTPVEPVVALLLGPPDAAAE